MLHESRLRDFISVFRQRDFVRNSIIVFLLQAVSFSLLIGIVPWKMSVPTLILLCIACSVVTSVTVSYIVTVRYSPYIRADAMLHKHYEDTDLINTAKTQPGNPRFIETVIKTLLSDWNIVQKEHKRLTSLLSHDMRTPLSQVISLCMLLDEETDPDVRQQYLDYIKSQSTLMLDMLTDTLHLMQAAGIQIKKTDVAALDLKTIVERVLQLLSSQMTTKQVSVIKDITSGLHVQAEEKRFILAIVQLLANAIKLSPAKGIICLKAREAGGRIIISIANYDDNDDILSEVFEAFPAVSSKGSLRFTDGNNPSLHLAEQIIAKHNGSFVAKDENGPDYFFQMHIPICAN